MLTANIWFICGSLLSLGGALQNHLLQELGLAATGFGEEGLKELYAAVRTMPKLMTIRLPVALERTEQGTI